jgi:hypothetical protein
MVKVMMHLHLHPLQHEHNAYSKGKLLSDS